MKAIKNGARWYSVWKINEVIVMSETVTEPNCKCAARQILYP